MQPTPTQDTVIQQTLEKFAAGDPAMFDLIAEDVDFRIDHFQDDADTSWQIATSRQALMQVVGRLGQEVFPKGTEILGVECFALGQGWHLTRFDQRFFYGVTQQATTSQTYIVSHEADGKLDYFRETVTNIVAAG